MTKKATTEGVLHRSIQGGKWFFIGNIVQRGIGFLSFFILARHLAPSQFGIVAIVLLIPSALNSITETGLASAVIQRGGDSTPYWNPIWTIGILRAIAIALLIFFFAPFIAVWFRAEHALTAIRLGGFFIIIYNLSNIGENYFFKDLDIRRVVLRNIARDTTYAVSAVICVLIYPSYWSLLLATGLSYASHVLATYILHPYRPKISFDFGRLRELFSYSKWMVGQVWLDQFYGFAEPALIAHLTTPTSVGLYGKGKNVASVLPGFLGPMLNIVSFSAYAKLKESPEKIHDGMRKSLDLIFFTLTPITILFLLAGEKLVQIALGDAWGGITPILKIFILYYAVLSIVELGSTLLNAIGLPRRRFKLDLIRIPLTLLLITLLTPKFGIIGAAAGFLIGSIPVAVLILSDLRRLAHIGYYEILRRMIMPLSISIFLALPVILFKKYLIDLPAIQTILLIGFAGIIYCIGCVISGIYLNHGPYKTIRLILQHLNVIS